MSVGLGLGVRVSEALGAPLRVAVAEGVVVREGVRVPLRVELPLLDPVSLGVAVCVCESLWLAVGL